MCRIMIRRLRKLNLHEKCAGLWSKGWENCKLAWNLCTIMIHPCGQHCGRTAHHQVCAGPWGQECGADVSLGQTRRAAEPQVHPQASGCRTGGTAGMVRPLSLSFTTFGSGCLYNMCMDAHLRVHICQLSLCRPLVNVDGDVMCIKLVNVGIWMTQSHLSL